MFPNELAILGSPSYTLQRYNQNDGPHRANCTRANCTRTLMADQSDIWNIHAWEAWTSRSNLSNFKSCWETCTSFLWSLIVNPWNAKQTHPKANSFPLRQGPSSVAIFKDLRAVFRSIVGTGDTVGIVHTRTKILTSRADLWILWCWPVCLLSKCAYLVLLGHVRVWLVQENSCAKGQFGKAKQTKTVGFSAKKKCCCNVGLTSSVIFARLHKLSFPQLARSRGPAATSVKVQKKTMCSLQEQEKPTNPNAVT